MAKKSALGKGLGALLTDADNVGKPIQRQTPKTGTDLELSKIKANPNQPRSKFNEEALVELAESIKQLGLIQPITVRKMQNDEYQIISGERRFRASKIAGLTSIPVFIREVADEDTVLAMAIVENLQREDLDAIEVATSFQRLIDECNLTQEQLSERVGKNRATISNYLRLLKLPPEIQFGIINDDISMGHARALITIEDSDFQVEVFTKIIENGMSVRETEALIRKAKEGKITPPKTPTKKEPDAFDALRKNLSDKFNADVKFSINPQGKGKITIPFSSDEDLERVLGIFDKISKEA